MAVLMQNIGESHTLIAKIKEKTNLGTFEASLFDTSTTTASGFQSALHVKLNGHLLFFFHLKGLNNRRTVVTATFGKELRGIKTANLRFTHQNTRTIVTGKVNDRTIVPYTVRCQCKNNSCNCEQPDNIRFESGAALTMRVDERLNRAVNQLLRKLFQEIAAEAERKRKKAGDGCIAACVAAFTLCSTACLSNPFKFVSCFENCERIKRNCFEACDRAGRS